jgi:hypothetical protein
MILKPRANYMKRNEIKIGILAVLSVWIVCFSKAEIAISAEQPDFKVIIGEWVRPDGGYIIRVRDVNLDGSVDVGYFNPEEINIAEANVSLWKGLVKLFIKLQDKGYPGSTYTLYYYAEKDALAGFYHQAAMGKTFKVVFLRKKVE